MFVGTRDEVLGELHDRRSQQARPSYDYLASQPAKALQELWRVALTKQREALVAAEVRHESPHNVALHAANPLQSLRGSLQGEDVPLARALKDELRTVSAFDADKAEAQAKKKKKA